jgi:hypothetical protein
MFGLQMVVFNLGISTAGMFLTPTFVTTDILSRFVQTDDCGPNRFLRLRVFERAAFCAVPT